MKRLLVSVVLGWYALVPPVAGEGVNSLAPLGMWEQIRAFDSAEQCEKLMMEYARQAMSQTDNKARLLTRQVERVRCIHSTDPRLRS